MMDEKRVLITGGLGFIGVHLTRLFLSQGQYVIALDDLSTSQIAAANDVLNEDRFTLLEHDICQPLRQKLPRLSSIVHLAGPIDSREPIDTLRVSALGTTNALELANEHNARIVLASSGAIYGEPQEVPQSEAYFGHVDSTGSSAPYEEGKRYLEALSFAYKRSKGVNIGIVRPFNVYGPDVRTDRRAIPRFIAQALAGQALQLYGGTQTRSLCFVGDFINGLSAMLHCDSSGPINLGSEREVSMAEVANLIVDLVGAGTVEVLPAKMVDASHRVPDAARARRELGWEASTPLHEGLQITIDVIRRMGLTGESVS